MVNATVLAFFKKPKEMLPVLSKLFSVVFERQKESPIIHAKCAQYYGMLQEDPDALEQAFLEFSETVLDAPDEAFGPAIIEINSLVLIYKKPQETFTKGLDYFVMQR